MTHVVKHHPGMALLEQYVEGSLSAEVALIVAAHIDFCPHCQSLTKDIQADAAAQLAQSPLVNTADDFGAMLSHIMQHEQDFAPSKPKPLAVKPTPLEVAGHQFMLPRALRRIQQQPQRWMQLGGIATCRLAASEPDHASLLFIDKHTNVPIHTHKGLEMTLVLSGEMVDENGRYCAGDLIINSPDDTHTPRNISEEPCLCLSVLSAPLHFTQGLTKLLNPLQRFFY